MRNSNLRRWPRKTPSNFLDFHRRSPDRRRNPGFPMRRPNHFPWLSTVSLDSASPPILDRVTEVRRREGENQRERPCSAQQGQPDRASQAREREATDFERTGGIRKPCTYSVSSGTTTLVWRPLPPSEVDKPFCDRVFCESVCPLVCSKPWISRAPWPMPIRR